MKHKYPRFLSVLCALMIVTSASWAVPAYRGWQTRTQPDGTTITVRQVGDEFYHYWETEDGTIAVEQPDGTFVVGNEQAPTGAQVVARRIAARNAKQPRRAKADYGAIQPTKLLVLLVNFSDKSMNSSHNKAFFQNLLNGSLPSVQDYFRTSSGGNYVPVFDVFGPYTLPNNMAYYGGNDSDGNDQHPDQMVVDACALAAADGCNFANYDTNNDGKVDNIYVIYAGYGEAAGAPANTIWPHSWEIYSSNVTGTLKYNNKYLGHYACSAELSGKSGSNSDGVGTFAHEFSHVIGLPDYYDTDYGTNSDNGVTPGEWTLMDQGSYNGSGQYPPLYSIYDKYFMGWTTPKFLAKDEIKNVTLTNTWNDAYQITGGTSIVPCTNTNTVYYIENRQKSGYDQYLPGHGMIVWKVTYNSNRWNNNDLNNTAGTLRYTIVPADGKTKNYGQATDPFPGTSNKKTWTPFTGCALTDITETSGNISFSYNGGVPKTTWEYVLYGENCSYPADGEITKNSKLELTITPSSGYTLADAACWDVKMGGTTLTYGTGFTYNAGTNKFTITSVTGDVEIIAEGGRTINWYAQGSPYKTNVSVGGKISLPDAPANCSASRQFVGWCTNSSYKSADTPPTYAKTGDDYSVANYYAVYADVSGGGSADATYTFTSKSWAATEGNWISGKDGNGYNNSGVQVTTGSTGANATCPNSYNNISSIVVSYCTNASSGAGSIKMSVNGTDVSESVTSSGGNTPRDLEFDFSETTPSGAPTITVNCGTNSIYICGVTITHGSASYSGFSTDCSAPDPCALTSISLNTDNVNKAFTVGDAFSSEGLVVTANYSNCSSKIVTPTSVPTPDMSSAGNKTVTVSYTENAVNKTATYQITVSAPTTYAIRFFDGTTKLSEESLTSGATATPPSVDDCDEYEFVGWWTGELATTNTTEQVWITNFTVSGPQDYYAVFSHSDGGSGGAASLTKQGSTSSFAAGDNIVIVGKGTTYALYQETVSTSYVKNWSFENSAATVGADAKNYVTLATAATNGKWYLGDDTNGYLYNTSGGNELYVKTDGSKAEWTISWNAGKSAFTIVGGRNLSCRTDLTGGNANKYRSSNGTNSGTCFFDIYKYTSGGSSTTYYTTTKDCTIPTEVTVKFNANGGEGTMTDQIIDYNTATALKANTFERTGYTFLGWATSSTGGKVYDDKEDVTLTKKETTLYAVWQKNSWKVYFPTPSGATSVTTNGETTSPLTIEYGETVTIVITPDAEHNIGAVTATGGAILSGEGGTRTFTMPDADVAISITMVDKPTYTINFINMGETISSQSVMDGQAALKPANPTACEGYTFVGWWTDELAQDNTTAQSWIETFTATGDQNYYAVYSPSGSSAPRRAKMTDYTKTFTFSAIASAKSWANGEAYTSVVDAPVTIAAEGGGNNGKWYTSGGGSWRMYSGGTVRITVDDGSVKSVTSTPSCSFTISEDGVATFSPSSRTDFTEIAVTYELSGGGGTTYTTDPACASCENKVNLTKGTDPNGTFTLDKANGAHNNCTSDFVVTVSNIVPAEGYRLANVTATNGGEVSEPDASGNYTVTYTKGNNITSTVTANFELIPSHTVTWSANGDNSKTDTYQEGKPIVFPETANGCDGKVFMGWSASTVEETDVAPTYTTSALMGTTDVTYYAVFATASSGSGGAFDGNTGGTFKIYAQVDDTKYYATGTGKKISSTTNAAEATSYTFTKVTGGWTIQSGDDYITYSSSTDLGTSESSYIWTIGSGIKGTYRLTSQTSGRGWIFRAGSDVFGGYSTGNVTASGTEYYDLEIGGGGTSYSSYTTSCTECTNKVTLTKGTPEHGTFSLNKENGEYNNCSSSGLVVTISGINPADGYEFDAITQEGIVTGVTIDQNAKTVTYAQDVSGTSTINVTFKHKPTYTIRFFNKGTQVGASQTVTEGKSATKPATDPTACDGYTFVGWWTATLAEDNTEVKTWITDFTATKDQDYYAAYSYSDGEGGGSSNVVFNFGYANDWGQGSSWSGSDKNSVTATKDGVTVTHTRGTGSMYANATATRFYKDNTLTFEVSGSTITSIVFTCSQYQTDITSDVGTCTATSSEFSWSGDASSVSFSRPSNASSYSQFSAATITVGGGSTTYYTTAPICAACENKVTLTKGTPANGSFTLDKDNGEYDNCKSKGFVVTVSGITPDEDYEFDAITQTGIAEGVTIDQEAKTVTYAQNVKGASTINVTFRHKPQYTIKFYDNGSVISEQLVTSDKSPIVPDDPEGCDEYEFVGWWTDELAEDNTATHTWVSSFTATENKNYYAVFRHVESGSGSSSINATFGTDWNSLFGTSYTGTFNPSANSLNLSGSNSGVSIDVTNGTSTNGYIKTSDFRAYNGYTVTITAPVGKNISSITFTKSSKNVADISASVGELTIDGGNGSWEGSSNSVSFSASGTCGFSQIDVTVGGGGTTYYTTDTDCRDCSIPTLSFAATTVNKFDGDAPFINALTIGGNTMGAIVSYTSSNPAKAEVSADGTVTINDAMSTEPVTITATLAKADDGVNCQKKVTAAYTLNIYNKVTWLVNGSEYATGSPTVQTAEGGTIDIAPTDPDGSTVCFGKTFVGWTTAEYDEDDAKPETLYSSSSIVGLHITQKTTFYAVFAELTGTLNEYRKGTPVQLTTGQKVIIVNTAANKAMKAVSSFKSGYDVTPVGDAFVTEEQSIIWTVEQADGGAYYFMYGDNYLNASGSSLYLDSDEDAWTVTGAGPYVITSGKYPAYSLEWYSNEFKSFSTGSGDAFNMDLYFPNWTIGAYSTNCGLCLPKPEVQSVIVKQDRVTVTWKSVAYATGYEFTCSGGEVAISGTTATITGLTPLSDYTYSLRAQGGDPYTCFRTTNGSFSTPDCDDMPYDITATPYNVVQAIIRWKAESERGKVIVYNDEACTSVFTTVADTVSPCYVSGLAENTRYWFKVFGGPSQDCASPVQTFLTQTTAVEIVEWQNDGVIILLTGDETTASVLIEDKQEKTDVETNVANNLFFSKYYEAAGNVKLWAVYNGTGEKISLENVKVQVSSNGAEWGRTSGGVVDNARTTSLDGLGHKEEHYIYPGEEIIVYNGGSSDNDAAVINCMTEKYGDAYSTNPDSLWYEIKNNTTSFSGDDGLLLLNGNDTLDVIGVMEPDYFTVGTGKSAKNHSIGTVSNPDGDDYGWCCTGVNLNGEESNLSTNRCILVRKNTVKDGQNAIAKNRKDFVTLCEEWWGAGVPQSGDQTQVSCDNFTYVGHYDYQDYYASYDTAVVIQDLVQNPDGTITIPIEGLDTMSCTMLRINVYDKTTQEQKASREYRIPIMIQSGEVKSTNELFTKHGVAVCKDCDVLVFNGATLKKDNVGEDRDTIGNLTLYPGSTLELPSGKGDYHVKSLTYRVEGDNVPATKLNGDLYSETQQLIVTRRIKNDRYYFISFPYDVNVNEITLANGSKAVNGKDFRLLEYDAETRAQEGSLQGVPGHWKMLSGDKLLAGRGYAIAVNTKAMKEILFPMTIPSKNLTYEERTKVTNTVDINEYVGAARNTNHNWNLIAHPYITKFEVTDGAANVEAYWAEPSRENTDWVDDWKTWDEPTQPTDSTHTQNPDSTGTQTDYIDRGTLNGGCIWVLYNDGTMELSGSGQVGEFSTTDDVPWKAHREKITSVKVIGEIQLINCYAFVQCTNLTNVTIAAPVSQINAQAFAACNQLTTIRIESSLSSPITADGEVFDGVNPANITLMVPQSLLTAYKNTIPWKNMTVNTISGSTTGNAPRRVDHPDGWTESPGGIYVTRPTVTDGKITYEQLWINDVTDIPPFTAMFIQGDGRGEMTFNMYPASPAPKRSARASRYETNDHTIFVGVSLHSTNGMSDLTSLRLRPDFGEHYKFGQDLLKFTVFNTSRPQLYIKTPDDQLAFRAISDSLAEHSWIPVGVYCRDAGTYTFSLYDKYVLDEIEAVYLHDNVTGVTTNLLYGNYTIETTKQLYTNTRFTLNVILRRKVDVDTPTIIDHTENPNAPRKFFRDGVMYIMRDGKIYDLTGKPAELDKLMLNR